MKALRDNQTRIIKSIALFSFATLLTLAINASANSNSKVVVCHIPPGNEAMEHEIVVSTNALNAHLGHGDHIGECNPEHEAEGLTGMPL